MGREAAALTSKKRGGARIIAACLLWGCILLLLVLMYTLSAQDGHASGALSERVTRFLAAAVNPGFSGMSSETQDTVVTFLHPSVRKLAHFTEYTLLGMLLTGAFLCTFLRLRTRVLLALAAGGLCAAADEVHQLTVGGRCGQWTDVAIDFAGVALGVALVCIARILLLSFIRFRRTRRTAGPNASSGRK